MNEVSVKKYENDLTDILITLSRNKKRLLVVSVDILIITFSMSLSFVIQQDDVILDKSRIIWWLLIVAPVIAIPVFSRFCLYQVVHRFVNTRFFVSTILAVLLHVLILVMISSLVIETEVSHEIFINYFLLSLLLVTGSRWIAREILLESVKSKKMRTNVAIYGAGEAGAELLDLLDKESSYNTVAFIDDKKDLQGTEIFGRKILATDQLHELIDKNHVEQVLLAIPSATQSRKKEILTDLEKYKLTIMTVPSLEDIVSGKCSVRDIREVCAEDLLYRSKIDPDPKLLSMCITDKCVMVTGAGGSIGSELSRQIIRLNPTRLILFELSEHALYQIERELLSLKSKGTYALRSADIIPILGTVTDKERLKTIMRTFNVDTVYHAAAYKHVPLVETNPIMGIINNAIGTWSAASAAMEVMVDTFVLVSTDKAVRPTNVMGASKRLAELAVQALARHTVSQPRYIIVRFGNVLESSGSVVPLFKEQIKRGGPVTITHPEIIRYFMTIPEAAQLVIQAGSMGDEGDVFVLDMGEPVKIIDLARRLITLSGFSVRDESRPDGDIEIKITGLRPGEKLYEELLIGGDVTATEHPQIMRSHEDELPYSEVVEILAKLEEYGEKGDIEAIRNILKTVVHGYHPQCDIADPVWRNTCKLEKFELSN
ncbi:MAG: nucleoside-diphosphate sugar epimerase/dehydratase [Pseudomonadota bacterium]